VKVGGTAAASPGPRAHLHIIMPRYLLSAAIALALVGCNTDTPKTSTGRTERETDSVIGQSKVPGAQGVKRAMDAQDSARARAAAIDTAAAQDTQ
jgi:hypothetical protein